MSAQEKLAAAEAEIVRLRAELAEERGPCGPTEIHGCGDNGCLVEKPAVGTNGGKCRCSKAMLRAALLKVRREQALSQPRIEAKGFGPIGELS